MPAERISGWLNINSIIFQAICKSTYTIFRLLSVVSDGNIHQPVNYISLFFVLAYTWPLLRFAMVAGIEPAR